MITEGRRSSTVPDEDDTLQSENFDPSNYINDRLKNVRMGDEARKLQSIRTELAGINQASSEMLRNNVFQNFEQFIDAAKEISHVEQEVYQLSALLTEQRSLIESLMQMTTDDKASVHTASSSSTFNSAANTTQLLLTKIDGIAPILNSMKANEKVVLHSEVTLLDPDTKQRRQRSYLVLLPDRLLVAAQSQPGKFSFESTFNLNSIAAVNVKDRESGGGDSAGLVLKLLVFPDQRYYRCDTVRLKQQWLDEIETAKRAQLREGGLQRQATIRGRRRTVKEVAGRSEIRDSMIEEEPETDEATLAWLAEVPAELDVCLAHKDLDQAVDLIREWKEYRGKDAAVDTQMVLRENQVVKLLSDSVRLPAGAHGGPKAMTRARTLLASLGRGTYAVDLYLQRRSTMLRNAYKDVTVTEEPLTHVRALCALYSTAAADILNDFGTEPAHFCQVLQFCSKEMSTLLTLVRKHVIEVVPTMKILSRTWTILSKVCDDMTAFGAQLTFEMHRLLSPAVAEALEDNFARLIHTFRLRMEEERWRGTTVESEAALARLCEEFSDLDLRIDWAISGPTSLHISNHVLEASRQAYYLAADLAELRSSPLGMQCDDYIQQVWTELLSCLTGVDQAPESHAYSTNFILTQVLPSCQGRYYDEGEEPLTRLLEDQFEELLQFVIPSKGEEEDEDEVASC
ncbi:exoc-8 [Pristionchus pacificus]|nr:exoc-8 [Pristionchus pacificus]